jgi:hypothetical protein
VGSLITKVRVFFRCMGNLQKAGSKTSESAGFVARPNSGFPAAMTCGQRAGAVVAERSRSVLCRVSSGKVCNLIYLFPSWQVFTWVASRTGVDRAFFCRGRRPISRCRTVRLRHTYGATQAGVTSQVLHCIYEKKKKDIRRKKT